MYCAIRVLPPPQLGGGKAWTQALARHSRFSVTELLPCANALARLQRRAAGGGRRVGPLARPLMAVHEKFSRASFHEVAKLPCADGLGDDAVQA
jgi:cyclin B